MTVRDWLIDWLTVHSIDVRQRTIESYTDIVRRYIAPALGEIQVDELTPGDVLHLLAGIVAEGHTRTAELTHVVLCAAMAEVRPDLMRRVRRPVHVQRVPQPWTDEEMAKYMAGLVGHKHELALTLAIRFGLRRGEICGLDWRDVDLRERTITIRTQLQRMATGELVKCPPKSRSGQRILPIPDDVFPLIRAHWQLSGRVCKLTPNALDGAHTRLVARLGLPHIPLHGLRHSMATACVRHGGDLRSLQAVLGHASYATTADRYLHPDRAMMCRALDSAGSLCYTGFRYLTLNQGVQGSSP